MQQHEETNIGVGVGGVSVVGVGDTAICCLFQSPEPNRVDGKIGGWDTPRELTVIMRDSTTKMFNEDNFENPMPPTTTSRQLLLREFFWMRVSSTECSPDVTGLMHACDHLIGSSYF